MHLVVEEVFPRLGEPVERRPLPTPWAERAPAPGATLADGRSRRRPRRPASAIAAVGRPRPPEPGEDVVDLDGYLLLPGARRAPRPPRQGPPGRPGPQPHRRPARRHRGLARLPADAHRRRHRRAGRAGGAHAWSPTASPPSAPTSTSTGRHRLAVGRGAGRRSASGSTDLVDLQIVALVSWPVTGPDGAEQPRRSCATALDAGADVVGGCPHLDPDPTAANEHAPRRWPADAGRPVDLHTDETLDPGVLDLRRPRRTSCAKSGLPPPGHGQPLRQPRHAAARRCSARSPSRSRRRASASSPCPRPTSSCRAATCRSAPPRGLTAIRPLLDAGVTLAAGADNLQDPFNLVGRADPMETAALMVMAGHLLPAEAYDAVSARPAAPCSACRPSTVEPGARPSCSPSGPRACARRSPRLRSTASCHPPWTPGGRRTTSYRQTRETEVHTGVTADRDRSPTVAVA